ncbi:hypothetical protein EDD21DRAFT_418803 [Dissophora ornata]|nr:hypothetical protein EDD21DRAFT_418803 [Dissophora ornata]
MTDATITSPEDCDSSHCVICLSVCVDRTVLETCRHEFCFHCILQWSIISHACPLCIRIFESCIHEIRDDTHYTVHRFEPLLSASKKSSTSIMSSSSSTSAATSSTSHQMAVPYGIIRQLYGPPQRRRHARSGQHAHRDETLDERSVAEQQQQALEQRRHVYRHRLFVKHVGANRISGFQQITPETFRVFPHKLDRLIPWIRRELRAILSLSTTPSYSSGTNTDEASTSSSSSPFSFPPSLSSDTEHLQHHRYEEIDTGLELIREYIVAVLKRYDLQTDQAHDLLKDFLQESTEQFVHELMAFARSPHSIEAYDRSAQYDSPNTDHHHQARLLDSSRSAEEILASNGYDDNQREQDSRGSRDGRRPRRQRSDSRDRVGERPQDSRESPDSDASGGDFAGESHGGTSKPLPSTSHANPHAAGDIQDTIAHRAPNDDSLKVEASLSSSKRDVLAAMLQEKLKRERDLYDARNRQP